MRWLAIATTTAAVIAGAAAVRAQPGEQPPVPPEQPTKPEQPLIGVLELDPSGEGTEIYTVPVADTLAKRLRKRSWRVERLTLDDAAVPTRFALIVRGRIVAVDGGVKLEVRVQDPERGIDAGGLASSAKPLTQIDTLTEELADGLDALLGRALDARRRRAAEDEANREGAVVLPEAVIEGRTSRGGERRDQRPPMVVFTVTGDAADVSGAHRFPVRQVTSTLYALADRLGFQPIATAEAGMLTAERARAELARTGAAWGLMVHVERIDFDWVGVLTARGRARVVLVDARGTTRYSATVRTDTLVGSRSDGYLALVRFVGTQLADIVEPQLRKLLGGEAP